MNSYYTTLGTQVHVLRIIYVATDVRVISLDGVGWLAGSLLVETFFQVVDLLRNSVIIIRM